MRLRGEDGRSGPPCARGGEGRFWVAGRCETPPGSLAGVKDARASHMYLQCGDEVIIAVVNGSIYR